ncbi:type II toxin-antitoxin system VapC family toxin [Agrobacterium genomosp. 3 str. CIP 111-78]|uniref:Type II toxin-antitoxin system VapC family toxin n=1 Tax=Agrobacterium tumefaciens TaxID=358 RepID=A0AAE6BLU6_AGRTU|nr:MULTISPECIES: type II toxin-antitoxin system VapC family toxin [Agrobacterium tumefaciens complex]MCA2374050.1 type II toxin-antitoxin system VapC family toxin [Agrobacterium tomkonis CIP 111-78]QCL99515.1 type II toxin-antitoxin system VapC family toxin [Agrobacterium tumefaciens]
MKYLLDTHALLWWLSDDEQLSADVRDIISDLDNDIHVSAASAWEIATKFARGRLPGASLILPDFAGVVRQEGFLELPINSAHMVRSAMLPGDHRDPFDRILAAQSILENMALISIDEKIPSLGIMTRW